MHPMPNSNNETTNKEPRAMPDGDALSLGEIQRRFSESLEVIESLKQRLGELTESEFAAANAGEQLKSAAGGVEQALTELRAFVSVVQSAVAEFGEAMEEAGKLVRQTTLADLEVGLSNVSSQVQEQRENSAERLGALEGTLASIQEYLGSQVAAANERAERAEVALNRIPQKYRTKYGS